MTVCISRICIHVCTYTRARAVRKVSVWPGHATFSCTHTRTHTHVPMRRGRYCVTVTTLSFYVTSRASSTQQKRRFFYMWEARINMRGHMSTSRRVEKGGEPRYLVRPECDVEIRIRRSSAITQKGSPKTASKYYDRSPSSDTRLSIDCRRKTHVFSARNWVMIQETGEYIQKNNICIILETTCKTNCKYHW